MITLKEQPHAAVAGLRFLVGEKRERARQVPVYADATHKVAGHNESQSERVQVFHVLGFGRTEDKAKSMARAAVGPDFFCIPDMGSFTRLCQENHVAA